MNCLKYGPVARKGTRDILQLAHIYLREIVHSNPHPYAETGDSKSPKLEMCTISENMVDPRQPEPAVVIVGAGIAGLSAAQRLNQCGISNFMILEATERPGGRIHSCWLGDVIAEMGAHHIIGACPANSVYNLACQEGLLTAPISRVDHGCKAVYCTSDGRAVDMHIALTSYHLFKQLEQEAATLFAVGCGNEHGSLMSFLAIRIQQELMNFPEEERYDASRVLYGMTNTLRTRLGDDLSCVSADNFGSMVAIPGGCIRIPLGLVGILAPLLRDLPDCSLKYKKAVANIRWGNVPSKAGGTRALVVCCDGEEFCADYVIITTSLGVLKVHASKLFSPNLPPEKLDAIQNLGYAHVNKVYLEYTRPFWACSEGSINFAWSADELNNRCEWVRAISAVQEVEGSKHILCITVAGPEALEMEKASDEQVADDITKVLRKFTGDMTLPYPSCILRSQWSSDPYFCGAYSYLGVQSTVGQQHDLLSPLPAGKDGSPPILLFAGEATCIGHYSTVHGARLSGIREAERIIQLTRKLKGPPALPGVAKKT